MFKRAVLALVGALIGVPLGWTIAIITGWRPAVAVVAITFGLLAVWGEAARLAREKHEETDGPTRLFERPPDEK